MLARRHACCPVAASYPGPRKAAWARPVGIWPPLPFSLSSMTRSARSCLHHVRERPPAPAPSGYAPTGTGVSCEPRPRRAAFVGCIAMPVDGHVCGWRRLSSDKAGPTLCVEGVLIARIAAPCDVTLRSRARAARRERSEQHARENAPFWVMQKPPHGYAKRPAQGTLTAYPLVAALLDPDRRVLVMTPWPPCASTCP